MNYYTYYVLPFTVSADYIIVILELVEAIGIL